MIRPALTVPVACCFVVFHVAAVWAAAIPDNGPGCGLGKLAWMDYGAPKQIAPQVMMATTNGTFGSQTFGISSGTSGCTNDGVIMKNKHINLASLAFEDLAQEMAQGRGEHLASLAALLGVPEEAQPEFFALVQERYATLLRSDDPTPMSMLRALEAAMAEHPILAKTAFPTEGASKGPR
ncbi:MAG TPA: DUF3015 domain-containing protein [Nitrospiraceae bacterium]|nr:DUF3015 domain-containing protein [Nitrospiraceae bacterium]